MNRVTIKDIARVVGIAPQNVSGVLNNSPSCRVSAVTREKIFQVSQELGYCKNISAQILRGCNTQTLAIVLSGDITNITDEYLHRIIIQLCNYYNRKQYACFLAEVREDQPDPLAVIKNLFSRGTREFISIGNTPYDKEIEAFYKQIGCHYIQYGTHLDRRCNFTMTEALRALWGRLTPSQQRSFKIITNPDLVINNRLSAIKALFPDWQQRIFASPLVSVEEEERCRYYMACGYADTEALLREFPDTEAVLYHSDYYLQGGVQYCLEHGIRIGQDIQLAGVNYSSMVCYSPFPLWSFSYPEDRFVDTMISELNNQEPAVRILEMSLCANQSMKTFLGKHS